MPGALTAVIVYARSGSPPLQSPELPWGGAISHDHFTEHLWDALFRPIGLLKERLDETLPRRMETREEFISRLHLAVAWVNRYRSKRLWELSTNQKERATECLNTEPPGGRTSF